jgi:hypothetical protein
MGASAYVGYNSQAGFVAGTGYGFGANGFGISSNVNSLGLNYSSKCGGSANVLGMQYSKQGGWIFNPSLGATYSLNSGHYGVFNVDEKSYGEFVGEPLSYDNETAESFMELNQLKRDGFDNLYADGTVAPGSKYGADGHVYYTKDGVKTRTSGAAEYSGKKYLFFGKQEINVYLYSSAFQNPEYLYLVIGHELIHVGLYNLGIRGDTEYTHNRHEATAHSWSYDQATLWGLSHVAGQYKNIRDSYNSYPYPYQKPVRTSRPVRP